MWVDLREEIELELEMLREHVDTVALLREKVETTPPDVVETMALGAFLHGFYNGIENAFKRIAIHVDGGPPRGEAWHQELLAGMAAKTPNRPAVISQRLADSLQDYLDFRHLFRNLYSYRLEWKRMAVLVRGCEKALNELGAELGRFLNAMDGKE